MSGAAVRAVRPRSGDVSEVGTMVDHGFLIRVYSVDREELAVDGEFDPEAFAGDYTIPYEDYGAVGEALAAGWRIA